MKSYQCHKKVQAFKIHQIVPTRTGAYLYGLDNCEDDQFVLFSWLDKHRPSVGGYFVLYDDGYESYSPSKVFEDGYTQID